MVLFILFPGFGMSEKHWDKYEESGKIKKTSFLQQLKKLGKVYTYTPKIYSIINLDRPNKIRKIFYPNPSNLTLDDLDIDTQCKLIYEDVKKYKGQFIPIGHSIGSYFAVHFSNLYQSRCIKTIFIDGSPIAPKNVIRWYKKSKKYNNITNDYLNILLNKIKIQNKDEKSIEKLEKIALYFYFKFFKKFNGKLVVPNLSIVNLRDIKQNSNYLNDGVKIMIDNQETLYKINGKKANVHYLINATHFPWFIPRYCDEIIEQIKCFIIS